MSFSFQSTSNQVGEAI